MPELPEVETIRAELDDRVRGEKIDEAWAFPSEKFTPALDTIGTEIASVGRRGKYLLFGLDNGTELVAHLGMTGRFSFDPAEADDSPHLRAWWRFASGSTLSFFDIRRFGRLRIVPIGDYETIDTLAQAGPEPFDPTFDGDFLYAALRASNRRVKTQLLSQRPVAGVGNIYADEALWRAGIYPAARRVTRAEAHRLRDAVVEVLAAGIDNGGTTLRDYRTTSGDRGTNQFHLACYGRGGQPCGRCGAVLRTAVWDARTTTFCPQCQRRR